MHWVDALIDVPKDKAEQAGEFWSQALGYPLGPSWTGHREFRSFTPDEGDAYLHLQTVGGTPRVHLDIEVDDVDTESERLVKLGASRGQRPAHWQVMASRGGLPFCLVPGDGNKARPQAVDWGNRHRSRLVQICIDAPSNLHQTETQFWRDATGWPFSQARFPEFDGRLRPAERGTLQFLLQRLGPDDDGDHTRAHFDLGTDNVDAEVDRLISLGAKHTATGSGWVVLQDPAGLAFCVTGNSPG